MNILKAMKRQVVDPLLTSGFYSDFLLDDKYIWFLKSNEKRFNFSSDPDLDLIKLNTKTGKLKQTIKLNYSQLLACKYTYIFGVKLIKKKILALLIIEYLDKLKQKIKKNILLPL